MMFVNGNVTFNGKKVSTNKLTTNIKLAYSKMDNKDNASVSIVAEVGVPWKKVNEIMVIANKLKMRANILTQPVKDQIMAMKKRGKVSAEFSMSSLTDIIFLLLIFFMLTSSMVTPNALNLRLPGKSTKVSNQPKNPPTQVKIDKRGKYTFCLLYTSPSPRD